MSTREQIIELEQKLKDARESYRDRLIAEVEGINARLQAISEELGEPVATHKTPPAQTHAVIYGGSYGPKESAPQPKNALRLVNPPRKTRTSTGRGMVLDALSTGPTSAPDIARAIDRQPALVRHHLEELVREGRASRDDSTRPAIYSLVCGDAKPATHTGITRGQMELLTALASGPKALVPLTLKIGRNHQSIEDDLTRLEMRGLVRELTNTEPSRWEMVQGASVAGSKA